MVRRIVPGGDIRSGASKNSGGYVVIELAAYVSAINRVQAYCPRKIEPSESCDPRGIRIVIVKLHRVRLVERVLHGLLLELRMAVDPAPPVALQIPVGPEKVGHVALKGDTALRADSGRGAAACDAAVVEADASLNAASGRTFERRLYPAVRLGRHDRLDGHVNGCERAGTSSGTRGFCILRSKDGNVAAFDRPFRFVHFGHRRTGRDGEDPKLRDS